MKLRFNFFFIIYALLFPTIVFFPQEASEAYATHSLVDLWNMLLTYDPELQDLQSSFTKNQIQKKYAASAYSPEIILSADTKLPENMKSTYQNIPDRSEVAISIALPLPGSLKLALEPSFSITRVSSGEKFYIVQSPSFTFTIKQGLFPWWLQGINSDPYFAGLSNAVIIKYYTLQAAYKQKIDVLTQAYISLRSSKRNVTWLKKSIEYHQRIFEAYTERQIQGALPLDSLWEIQRKKTDIEQKLLDIEDQADKAINTIFNLCGINEVLTEKNSLPFLDESSTNSLILLESEPEKKAYAAQRQAVDYAAQLRLQNTAPTLKLSASILWMLEPSEKSDLSKAWSADATLTFTLGCSLDLSPLFSATGKREAELDRIQHAELQARITNSIKQHRQNRNKTIERLARLYYDENLLQKSIEQLNQLVEDSYSLLQQGKISQLDYDLRKLNLTQRQIGLSDTEDQIWYCQFLLDYQYPPDDKTDYDYE